MSKNIGLVTLLLISFYCQGQTNTATDYINQSQYRLSQNDYKGAIELLTTAIGEMPDSVILYDMRGVILDELNFHDDAIKDFTKGIDITKNIKFKAHLLANRAGSKFKIRDYIGCYNDLVESVRIDTTNIDAFNNLAAVCDEVNRPDETFKYLFKVISIDSNYSPAFINIGYKYQVMNKFEESIKYFDKAAELTPDDPLCYSNRSLSKLKINDLQGAMNDINISLSLMPSNSYAYKIRALIHLERKATEDACLDLAKANELKYSEQYGAEVDELRSKFCH